MRQADAEMARLVLADAAERLLQHRHRGALVHRVEQRGRRHLAEQEGGEQHRHRVFVDPLLERLPVARAVVVEPLDVVAGELAQRRLRLVAERAARREQLDRAAADLLVVDLVAGDREEALADRVLLVGLVGVDHRAREHRRARAVEHREQREPVGDRVALVLAEGADVERAPRQARGRPAGIARGLVDLEQLRRLDVPLDREDVHLRQGRGALAAVEELLGLAAACPARTAVFSYVGRDRSRPPWARSQLRPPGRPRHCGRDHTEPDRTFKFSRFG